MYHLVLTSSTQRQNRSFHVVERTRTDTECKQSARTKLLFLIVEFVTLLLPLSWLLMLLTIICLGLRGYVVHSPHVSPTGKLENTTHARRAVDNLLHHNSGGSRPWAKGAGAVFLWCWNKIDLRISLALPAFLPSAFFHYFTIFFWPK